MKRIYILELEQLKNHGTLSLSAAMFHISRLINFLDSDHPQDQRILLEAISAFAEKNPSYRIHSSFDLFEGFSDFLSFAHLQLSNPEPPGRYLSRPRLDSQAPVEEELKPSKIGSSLDTENQGYNSPFFAGISGDIATRITCDGCGAVEERGEGFMSLNFRLLQAEHVKQIRQRFTEEGYTEGLVTKQKENRSWALFKMFAKKTSTPVLTIRDYLCYLNLIQTFQIKQGCSACKTETSHTVAKLLKRAPEILVVGFTENEEDQGKAPLDFRIDLEFDISPFVSQAQNKYELLTAITVEDGPLGIHGDAVYLKTTSEVWVRIDQFTITEINPNILEKIVRPTVLIYQKRLSPDQERKNIESNFDLRDQFDGVELAPLPCFYMEALKLLGLKPQVKLSAFLCPHRMLMPVYRDIYPLKLNLNEILEWEVAAMQKKRACRPERKLSKSTSAAFKRALLGTTLLPRPIVDYVLEKGNSRDTVNQFEKAWEKQDCKECLAKLRNLRKRRTVEQYLFLKYDMADLRRKHALPVEWGIQWFQYLFYDTEMFQDAALAANYQLPVLPDQYICFPGIKGIQTNQAVWELAKRFYADEPSKLSTIDEDLINPRDNSLIDKALEGRVEDQELEELDERVKRLIDVRLQKVEMENVSDPWIAAFRSDNNLPPNEPEEGNRSPKIQLFQPSSQRTDIKDHFSQEYFDSDSDKEQTTTERGEGGKKQELFPIDEERSDQLAPTVAAEPKDNNEPVTPKTGMKSENKLSTMIKGERVNTGSYMERGNTDYVTTDAAIKNFLQKNVLLREAYKNQRASSITINERRGSMDFNSMDNMGNSAGDGESKNKQGKPSGSDHIDSPHTEITPKNKSKAYLKSSSKVSAERNSRGCLPKLADCLDKDKPLPASKEEIPSKQELEMDNPSPPLSARQESPHKPSDKAED